MRNLILTLTLLGLVTAAGGQQRPHAVFLLGEPEYKSELTLPGVARELESRHGMKCTLLFSSSAEYMPGLEALREADVVVMYFRFRLLPEEQMAKIKAYLDAGKPVVALRTSTHAFNNWKEFGQLVLGAPWRYHYGHESSTDVTVVPAAAGHPILEGVDKQFHVRSWLYHVIPLPAEANALLMGHSVGPSGRKERVDNPVAWTHTYKGGRVFYTSLGHPEDFGLEPVRRLVINGIRWAAGVTKP